MPSKIQVDQIAGATGSTVTLPSGQTLDLSSGTVNLPSSALSALNASNLTSGTVPSARLSLTSSDLPTVPITKGGTGLTTLGTAGQALKVNSGATGLEFGSVGASAGQVIQVLSATDNTNRFSNSNSFTTASNTLSVSITPSSASNKILILTNVVGRGDPSASNIFLTIYRDGTNLGNGNQGFSTDYNGFITFMSGAYLDSPNTTSAVTYQVYFRSGNSVYSVSIGQDSRNTITVLEVKA